MKIAIFLLGVAVGLGAPVLAQHNTHPAGNVTQIDKLRARIDALTDQVVDCQAALTKSKPAEIRKLMERENFLP